MSTHFSYKNPEQLKKYLEILRKNLISRRVFYNHVLFEIKGRTVLEIGVREGMDFDFYKKYAKELYGIEADKEIFKIAQKQTKDKNILLNDFDLLPYADKKFDVVLSKYTIPQSSKLSLIYKEVARVLKSDGLFIFLVNHPFRQFYERTDLKKNYFNKEIIHPKLFEGLFILNEYTYTFNEYFSDEFLSLFDIEYYIEKEDFDDLSSEKIGGDIYPAFLLIKARKRNNKRSNHE